MSYCVECADDQTTALDDDYLCKDHRDVVDGARYCKECKKRWIPEASNKEIFCASCVKKSVCEYCQKLYVPKKPTTGKNGSRGVKFLGLCKACKTIAYESIPLEESTEGEHLIKCPECYLEFYPSESESLH